MNISRPILATFFASTLIKSIGSYVLQDITNTNQGKVTNSIALMGSFSLCSRQSLELSVSLLLFLMNIYAFLTQEKFIYKHFPQSHDTLV